MNVLVTRKAHDALLGTGLLAHLFRTYTRSWGLAGVTFHGVRQEDRDAIAKAVA